ncbi:MAG: Hsp20/alpha crystallin family protein [Symploca sp. SIO3C6]|uniref:Hsp20/alpha crystallin family protein n=1 Tax=Symploca sp. SIO1C4 TaxID=2607765 RepID=A0A6B3NIS8_9CYAN|nr:Hsp20/alpha crystallin family protein [Symploca sp. SIO3C6]NER29128.1 Hsp20/alpha crystallin family protein [Symploca sp. SIO1C4]NET07648.1 Hsp20/alpha crystallin family protein [Symploca sp. SIO2B6]
MALVRWEPFREIDSLQREMNRLFDNLTPTYPTREASGTFMPPVEMEEDAEAIHLKLEIPGIDSKDLDVQVTREAVSICGERKSETKTQENGVTRSEFRYGKFKRVIPLPSAVVNSQVQAKYKDGVLNLTLPKAEEEKTKIVKVKIN